MRFDKYAFLGEDNKVFPYVSYCAVPHSTDSRGLVDNVKRCTDCSNGDALTARMAERYTRYGGSTSLTMEIIISRSSASSNIEKCELQSTKAISKPAWTDCVIQVKPSVDSRQFLRYPNNATIASSSMGFLVKLIWDDMVTRVFVTVEMAPAPSMAYRNGCFGDRE